MNGWVTALDQTVGELLIGFLGHDSILIGSGMVEAGHWDSIDGVRELPPFPFGSFKAEAEKSKKVDLSSCLLSEVRWKTWGQMVV